MNVPVDLLGTVIRDRGSAWLVLDTQSPPFQRLVPLAGVAGFARSTILLLLGWLAWNTLPFPRRYGVFRRLFRRLWFDAVTLTPLFDGLPLTQSIGAGSSVGRATDF